MQPFALSKPVLSNVEGSKGTLVSLAPGGWGGNGVAVSWGRRMTDTSP